MNSVVAPSPLLFDWSPPRRRAPTLILFLLASLLLHAFCFYVFQIVYPPGVALTPAPARLNLISANDPESAALLHWIEAEDPALAITTQRAPENKLFALPKLRHVPSYATHEPALETLPTPAPNLSIPSSLASGAVKMSRLPSTAPAPIKKTTAIFSDNEAPVLPGFTFKASRAGAPANIRFRVAIDHQGAVRFCFPLESSGDPALDEQARNFLQLCRFKSNGAAPASAQLSWTIATVLWGNDISPSTQNSTAAAP